MNIRLIFFLVVIFSGALKAQHDHAKKETTSDTTKKSIPKETHVQIGEVHMMIHYHSPAVRGRVIWGGLVPYGEVWVTGAHSATTWEFNKDISIDGKVIPHGKYAVFTIPDKDSWIFILNKKWDQHLTDEYDGKDDVLRLKVPTILTADVQERLKYFINQKSDTEGRLSISWEKVKIEIPFQLK